ncbi:PREDICTED: kinetochore protein ndc80 [Ceratosolen solmsi marchali]|uniref:Kinetochore protein NDC80 n=1 Tax=Ceratosolen solmsi marchali TaxID=326594 RepID=A0AAJ6YGM4_9HYME|nr:PREDICTED: kinetochore protein ndc80 [Ceratosolen solmsi marchali]
MRKSTNTTRRRSLSNPGRFSQQDQERNSLRIDSRRLQGVKTKDSNFGAQETMIPKPRIRSSSSDRLSGLRKSNLRPTTGPKTSIGQYTTASSVISPMPNSRYTHGIEGNRGRVSYVDQGNLASKGYITPMATGSRHIIPTSDGRGVRASSAERASALVSKGTKKDSRPLTDKNYQNEMLSKIDNYFHSIGQSTILNNNGSMKPLTLKIFVEATNLLIKLLDMKLSLSVANYIEEIPKVAKKLHYPGLMNKSWLKTANTMHSWPHAIGWICWLVELCEVKDLASEIFTLDRLPMIGESEEEKENRRKIFLLMINCYKAWNEEKPEDEESIIQNFFQEEAERRGINAKTYEKVQLEFEKAQKNLDAEQEKTNKVNEEINELQEVLSNIKKDQLKQQEHIAEQEKYIEKTLKEIDQLNKDSSMFIKDIENLDNTKDELNNIIKQQPMSVIERDEIVKVCTEQQAYIQNFEAHLEEIKKEAYSLDIRLVSSNTNLVKSILAYNQALFMQLSDCNTNIDELLMPENGICESNFMSRLEERKVLMDKFMQEQSNELSKKMNLIESHNREIEAMQTKRDTLSEKVEKKKATEEKQKQELKNKENKKREEIKRLQCNISDLNESIVKLTNELDSVNQQLADSIDKKEAVERKNAHLKESAKTLFMQMSNILDEHRSKIRNSLETYLKRKT